MNLNIIIIGIIIICLVILYTNQNRESFENAPILDLKKDASYYKQTDDEIIKKFIKRCINNPAYIKRIKEREEMEEESYIIMDADLISREAVKNNIELEKISAQILNIIDFNKIY